MFGYFLVTLLSSGQSIEEGDVGARLEKIQRNYEELSVSAQTHSRKPKQ